MRAIRQGLGSRLWHSKSLRIATFLLIIVPVTAFIYQYARHIEWHSVWQALREIPAESVAAAAGAGVLGYLAYAGLDLLSQPFIRQPMSRPAVLGIAALSYALNLNLGVVLGSLGTRLRLYTRLGCPKETAMSVALFASISNWLGYCCTGGAVFLLATVPLPLSVPGSAVLLPVTGGVLLLMAAAYGIASVRHAGYRKTLRGVQFEMPNWRIALLQAAIGSLSWACMGLTLYLLLQGRVAFAAILGILLYSGVAALLTRMPGGLGTTETLFVAALAGQLAPADTLGAVLAYRAVYFIMPLGLSLLAFAMTEAGLSWQRRRHEHR